MKLYNTMTRSKEEFVPREEGKVAMYVCGPTVYNHIHLGNARTFLSFDTIRRYLLWKGYDVTFVQNVTDVDDKIINKANEEGRSFSEVANEYTEAFIEAMDAVNVLPPTMRPKATETIPEMIDLIKRLIEGGHAYEVEGDVYFAVRSFPEYGKLSGRNIDDLCSGARIEVDERKKDPLDFALWKAAKPGEPSWTSPWGEGRPGWHTECSAMSEEELGLPFDIHGGGVDLIFPHHENEIAQAEAATGSMFSRYWLHGGMLQVNQEKMSKSLNNFFLLKDVLKEYKTPVIRLFMLQTHYRSPLDFSDARLAEAQAAFDRLVHFVETMAWIGEQTGAADGASAQDKAAFEAELDATRVKFETTMDDDFNTAGALGAIFELSKEANSFYSAHESALDERDRQLLARAGSLVVELLDALGVQLVGEIEQQGDEYPEELIDLAEQVCDVRPASSREAVDLLLDARAKARAEKNWAIADAVRDGLSALGFTIEDTSSGSRVLFNKD